MPESTRRPHGGQFQPGPDPRRHRCTPACTHKRYQFTAADRSKGFWTAIAVWGVSMGVKLHAAGRWPNFKGGRA